MDVNRNRGGQEEVWEAKKNYHGEALFRITIRLATDLQEGPDPRSTVQLFDNGRINAGLESELSGWSPPLPPHRNTAASEEKSI